MTDAREVIALELVKQDCPNTDGGFGFTEEELIDADRILYALEQAGYKIVSSGRAFDEWKQRRAHKS